MAATAAKAMKTSVEGAMLRLACAGRGSSPECGDVIDVPFTVAGSLDLLGQALGEAGWLFALASPPDDPPPVFDPMCLACAKVEMPELVKVYEAAQAAKAH